MDSRASTQADRINSIPPALAQLSRISNMPPATRLLIASCRCSIAAPESARSAHSQIVMTFQLASANADVTRESLDRLASSFSRQKPRRVVGKRKNLQFLCACQKHPLINTAACHLVSTRSGLPGRSRRYSRNRKPAECSIDRTTISGCVSLPRIPDIRRERISEITTSATGSSCQSSEIRHAPN